MLTTMAPYSPNEKTRVFLSVFPHPASHSSSDAYREHRRRSWRYSVSSEGTGAARKTRLIFLQRSEVSVRNRQPSFEKLSSPRNSITSILYSPIAHPRSSPSNPSLILLPSHRANPRLTRSMRLGRIPQRLEFIRAPARNGSSTTHTLGGDSNRGSSDSEHCVVWNCG